MNQDFEDVPLLDLKRPAFHPICKKLQQSHSDSQDMNELFGQMDNNGDKGSNTDQDSRMEEQWKVRVRV